MPEPVRQPTTMPTRLLSLLLAASLAVAALPLAGCLGPAEVEQAAREAEREPQPAPSPEPAPRKVREGDLLYTPAQEAAQRFDYQYAEAATQAGGEALARDDLAEARRRFETAIEAWPMFEAAWQGLLRTAERQGDAEAEQRARFFLARLDWVEQVHPLAAAVAFRNLSEGRVTDEEVSGPAYRQQAARLVDFLESADVANVEAANRAAPGETFIQRYGIYVAGAISVGLIVTRFNSTLFGAESETD